MAKRLYIVTATIEFEYAVMAESPQEAERMTRFAREEWDEQSLGADEAHLTARLARMNDGHYTRPDLWQVNDYVYGTVEYVTFAQAVEADKTAVEVSPAKR